MSYFEDLKPHTYSGKHLDALSVGYLSADHPYPKGDVSFEFLLKLSDVCLNPLPDRYMGQHSCEICPKGRLNDADLIREGRNLVEVVGGLEREFTMNAQALGALIDVRNRRRWVSNHASTHKQANCGTQFRVEANGRSFVGPTMILHYIIAHGYRPPDEFVAAVMSLGGIDASK